MTQIFGFVLFLLALVVHEAGHAIAMRRRGVEIKEMGIGLPLSGRFRLTFRPRFLPFPLVLTPILLGAYVMPTDEGERRLKSLNYKDQAVCSAAGVIMNLIFAGVLVVVTVLARGIPATTAQWVLLGVGAAIAILSFLLRRPLSWTLPILGVLTLVYFVYSLVTAFSEAGGPGAVIGMAASSSSLIEALIMGAAISLSLALFNLIPLMPLDGGRVVSAFLQTRGWKKVDTVYTGATVVAVLLLMVVFVGKDIVTFFLN